MHLSLFILLSLLNSFTGASEERTAMICRILSGKRSNDLVSDEVQIFNQNEMMAIRKRERKLEPGHYLTSEEIAEILLGIDVEGEEESSSEDGGDENTGEGKGPANISQRRTNIDDQISDTHGHIKNALQISERPSLLTRLQNKNNALAVAVVGTFALAGGIFIATRKQENSLLEN